jgi:hypothetical protein
LGSWTLKKFLGFSIFLLKSFCFFKVERKEVAPMGRKELSMSSKNLPKWAKICIVLVVVIVIATSTFGAVFADGDTVCPLTDKGVEIFLTVVPNGDGRYELSSEMDILQPFAGCSFIIEGRTDVVDEHHIYAYKPENAWYLAMSEFSIWAYPPNWNMMDDKDQKPSVAEEFAASKRINQKDNNYNWPIFVHWFDGDVWQETVYGTDFIFPENDLDRADFDQPQEIAVHGLIKGDGFVTSIGAINVFTVANIDGQYFLWFNAKENIEFKNSIQAWLMPSSWSINEIVDWVDNNFSQTLIFLD